MRARATGSVLAAGLALAILACPAIGIERFPPPEFESGYQQPAPTTPMPRADAMEILDLAVLGVALAGVSYLVLRYRRRWAIALAMLGALAYFGFYRQGCVCPIGAIQNVANGLFQREAHIRLDAATARAMGMDPMAAGDAVAQAAGRFDLIGLRRQADGVSLWVRLADADSATLQELRSRPIELAGGGKAVLGDVLTVEPVATVPWVVLAFFLLPLATTLLWGRTFCAAVCPLGAIQDAVILRPLAVPTFLERALGLLPFVYLAVAVLLAAGGGTYIICRWDPFVSLFRLSGSAQMLILGSLALLIGVFVARPYCRFLCPYGAMLRLLGRLSWRRTTITPRECIQCRLCENTCPIGAIRPATRSLPARQRLTGKGALAVCLAVGPLLVAGGILAGDAAAPVLAGSNPTYAQAQTILKNRVNAMPGSREDRIFRRADEVLGRFIVSGRVAGGFVGLVVAGTLIGVSIRRRRDDYEADRSTCVSCGRCFEFCPVEKLRRQGKALSLTNAGESPSEAPTA